MGSDNPVGAENQQERLIELGWVIGFVDGEGCFSIGFVHQNGGGGRVGYRTGYQVAHEFAVTQGAQSVDCLHGLVEFFGVGQVIANKRHDDHREAPVPLRRSSAERVDRHDHPVLPRAPTTDIEARQLREIRDVRRVDRRRLSPHV